MKELLAYALLCCAGYDCGGLYDDQLDKLFLEHPDSEEYLYLESLPSRKDAALHTVSALSGVSFDAELFGRALMKLLGQAYAESDLAPFSRRMYSLWTMLPPAIQYEEPFHTLNYADDCLSYGDENRCRKLYEEAFHFYDEERPGIANT